MKKILHSILFVLTFTLGISYSSFAQYDLSTDTILFPVNGSTFQTGLNLPLNYVRSNAGAVDIPSTDTVLMSFFLNGNAAGGIRRAASVFTAGTSDTAGITFPFGQLVAGTYEVCVVAGFVASSSATDTDPTNDTACTTIDLVSPDMAVTAFEAVDPALNDGDTLPTGDTIVTMTVTFTNEGTVPFFADFDLITYIGTDTAFLTAPNNAGLLPDSSITFNLPGNLLPTEPTAPGPFTICASSRAIDDADPSNDGICNTYVREVPSTATTDLSFESIAVTDPAIPAGGTYNVGTTISEIQLTVRNTGTTDYAGTITADLSISTSVSNISETPTTAIAAGDVYTITVTGNDIPAFPTVAGNFQLCADLTISDDDASNDNGCVSFTAETAGSVVEINGSNVRAYYAQSELIIESESPIDESVNLTVYSITGREMLNRTVNLNSNRIAIPFGNVASGVYILSVNETAIRFVK